MGESQAKAQRRKESSVTSVAALSTTGRWLVLASAFLGWTFAGAQMALTTLVMRSAMIDLLGLPEPVGAVDEALVGQWSAWLVGAFLLGAAAGGLVFGWVGDRLGRSRAMGLSILCFSLFCGATYFVESPIELIVLRLLVGLGIGGTWPNGVALVSETWSNASRPMLAGVMGAAANVGLGVMSAIGMWFAIEPANWEWAMLVGAVPGVLALVVFVFVPESPRWLASCAARESGDAGLAPRSPALEVFRPPLLGVTLVGIVLGTVPLIGGWGSANWLVPWAEQVGSQGEVPDYSLKAATQFWRSVTSIVGSLLGGWLPLFLPELFPTHARSTGAGVSYNFGRILTVVTVFASGELVFHFGGDYAQIGTITSFIFAVGMVVILLAPDTAGRQMED